MGRFTRYEKQRLLDLVADCMLQQLSETQSLDYITKSIGIKDFTMSARNLYNLKQEVREDETRQINLLKREGFVHEHMQRIAEVKRGQRDLWGLWNEAEERIKNPATKIKLQTNIRAQLDESSKTLMEMYDALPFIAAVQTKLAKEAAKEEKTVDPPKGEQPRDAPISKPSPSVS